MRTRPQAAIPGLGSRSLRGDRGREKQGADQSAETQEGWVGASSPTGSATQLPALMSLVQRTLLPAHSKVLGGLCVKETEEKAGRSQQGCWKGPEEVQWAPTSRLGSA